MASDGHGAGDASRAGQGQPFSDDATAARVGQILNDHFDRVARGEAPSEIELLAAYPELAAALRDALSVLTNLGASTRHIETLLRLGVLSKPTSGAVATGTQPVGGETSDFSGAGDVQSCIAELGPYRVLSEIGSGGMGIVLAAREERLGRTVAIKVLRPELADNPDVRRRFARDARAAAKLEHPNIIEIYTVGESAGVPYTVMEYVDGPSLAELIHDRGALDAEIIRYVLERLLRALEAAHSAGIVHRDVKSANILLDTGPPTSDPHSPIAAPQSAIRDPRYPTVKLADFGLVRWLDSQSTMTQAGAILGTPEYMSPEQARGDADIDHRTDLYSVGVVLYEMLTGEVPFKADTPAGVIHQVLHVEPRDARSLNPAADQYLTDLACWLMAKEPEGRPPIPTDALEVINGMRRPAPRPGRRSRRIALVAGVAVILVALFVWAFGRETDNSGGFGRSPIDEIVPQMSGVLIDPDRPCVLLAWYDGDPTPREFLNCSDWPRIVNVPQKINAAHLFRPAGQDRKWVVIGLETPLADGANVIAYDGEGEWLWQTEVADQAAWFWRDLDARREWACRIILPFDLDHDRGDELIVVAQHKGEFPTRLSILDSGSGTVKRTLWHVGNINGLHVEPEFWGDRPAIIAWGQNNKLDAYEDIHSEVHTAVSEHDKVGVAMILDPSALDGFGFSPPHAGALGANGIHAYVYLDLPAGLMGSDSVLSQAWRSGHIDQIEPVESTASPCERPCLLVHVVRSAGAIGGGARVVVDRNLEICKIVPNPSEIDGAGEEESYWRQRWRRIVPDTTSATE